MTHRRRLNWLPASVQLAVLSDSEDIINVIETLFQAGITKDVTPLREIHLDDSRFSSFSDLPPYDLKDYQTTIELEELRFVSISDYQYEIKKPKISIFGDAAVVAIELVQKGMLVDNKAYTGEHVVINGRATFCTGEAAHVEDCTHTPVKDIEIYLPESFAFSDSAVTRFWYSS